GVSPCAIRAVRTCAGGRSTTSIGVPSAVARIAACSRGLSASGPERRYAWGWWTVGTYALYAAIGLSIASVAVFLAFLYEVLLSPKRVLPGVRRRVA
ncbi:MAG TPA: hypothetical protein VNL71_01405, partial [Chloroflexota bacterium]|nr:hypothetical protein [Chloroflexota bacterium]